MCEREWNYVMPGWYDPNLCEDDPFISCDEEDDDPDEFFVFDPIPKEEVDLIIDKAMAILKEKERAE